MEKRLAEHIFNLVKHGHHVAVKEKGGFYEILKGLNPDGTFYGTSFEETLEVCKKNKVRFTCSTQELQNDFTDEYEIVTEPPIPYKKGDLVDILLIAKEVPGFKKWYKGKKEMVGQKGLEIKGVYDDGTYLIYTKDKSDYYTFSNWCLAPHLQEEPDDKIEEAMQLINKSMRNKEEILTEVNKTVKTLTSLPCHTKWDSFETTCPAPVEGERYIYNVDTRIIVELLLDIREALQDNK